MRWLLLRILNNVFNIFFKSLIFIIISRLTVTISSEYSSVFFTGGNSFEPPQKINKIPLNIRFRGILIQDSLLLTVPFCR